MIRSLAKNGFATHFVLDAAPYSGDFVCQATSNKGWLISNKVVSNVMSC